MHKQTVQITMFQINPQNYGSILKTVYGSSRLYQKNMVKTKRPKKIKKTMKISEQFP